MGLSDGRTSFRIRLAVLIQYRSVTDTQPATQPASHVAVAITLNAKASSLKIRRRTTQFDVVTLMGRGLVFRMSLTPLLKGGGVPALPNLGVLFCLCVPELVMGHFFRTQPNPKFLHPTQPTHKSSPDPTQPIIDTWYGTLGYTENFIQQLLHVTDKTDRHSTRQLSMKVIIQLQYSLTDSRVFRDVKNITQSSLHPTQPTKN